MNVLIMADYRTPASGNFIASLVELAEYMKAVGNSMVFVIPETSKEGGYTWANWLKKCGNEVIYFNEKKSEQDVLVNLKKIINHYQIDLIHSHFGYLHRILVKNKRPLGVKVLFHDHMDYSVGSNVKKQITRQWIYAAVYRINHIGVISVMEKKSRGYWLCGKKLHWYIPNGLSLKRNIDKSLTREEYRTLLGIDENEKLCLFLGWDIQRKGVDIAIKAVEELRKKGISIVLGIVGFGGNPSDERLDKIKYETGLDPRVNWIRFIESTEDMFALHRASDVYLSASRFEAFSYGILEAISQNVPVVVSDIIGTRWSWEYNKCVTFISENVDDCTKAIQKAVELRNELSNAEEMVCKFGIDVWCERVMQIYEKMMV